MECDVHTVFVNLMSLHGNEHFLPAVIIYSLPLTTSILIYFGSFVISCNSILNKEQDGLE